MFIKEHLENGIPVVMESFKTVRAVAVGVWVKVGSRYESREENGISHFLEHMLFKGTKSRTTREIKETIEGNYVFVSANKLAAPGHNRLDVRHQCQHQDKQCE